MKINFPRVYAPVNLAEYAPGFDGIIEIWCNPPRQKIMDFVEAIKTSDVDKLAAGIAELWRDWTAEDFVDLYNDASDTDPALIPWLVRHTLEQITAHREGVKKNQN